MKARGGAFLRGAGGDRDGNGYGTEVVLTVIP